MRSVDVDGERRGSRSPWSYSGRLVSASGPGYGRIACGRKGAPKGGPLSCRRSCPDLAPCRLHAGRLSWLQRAGPSATLDKSSSVVGGCYGRPARGVNAGAGERARSQPGREQGVRDAPSGLAAPRRRLPPIHPAGPAGYGAHVGRRSGPMRPCRYGRDEPWTLVEAVPWPGDRHGRPEDGDLVGGFGRLLDGRPQVLGGVSASTRPARASWTAPIASATRPSFEQVPGLARQRAVRRRSLRAHRRRRARPPRPSKS